MTIAGVASATFFDDFEEPMWSSSETVFFKNGYTDDGGTGLQINGLDGIASSQGMIQSNQATAFGRSVHAGNLGGSTTASVSGYLRAVAGQATLKLTDNSIDQQGYEAEINFFGFGQGGNTNRVETAVKHNNSYQDGEATTPGEIDFNSLGWIEAEIGYTGGTTLSARWRDVDDNGTSLVIGTASALGLRPCPPTRVRYRHSGKCW